MKKSIAKLALLQILALLLVSCASEKPSVQTIVASYETGEQIKAMPSCKATVEQRAACWSLLRAQNGMPFYIGSPGATEEVTHFLNTLNEGQTYRFPDDFLKFQRHYQPEK